MPRVDGVQDKLGSGRIFPLFHLLIVSSFRQIAMHKIHDPRHCVLYATHLFELLVMPQGDSVAPDGSVKVSNEVIKDLANVAAYLDGVIAFHTDPAVHVLNIKSLFKQPRNHNLNLSPSKAKIGATDGEFLGHTISPTRVFGRTSPRPLPSTACRCPWISNN